MSDKIADVSIGITADNKTDKGAKAAEKRLSQVSGNAAKSSRKAFNDNERLASKSARTIIGSFSRIEQATAKALGSKSITAGLAGRVGALTEATSALGDGLAGAAASGSTLGAVAGMLTTTVGALAAGVVAAAYAGYKLADGWAQSAASIGRTASVIGVGTRALQEFTAAAERAGVDKNTAAGAAAGLSQTLNDARYGRNSAALEAMRRSGITMQTNKDGTVNVDAMLPGIADALQRQNSSGRRTLARLLGIPEGAIPAFSQGGKALSTDMKDAGNTAAVASDKDIANAQNFVRKEVRLGQLKDKAVMVAGREAAQLGQPVLDGLLKAGLSINDGGGMIQKAGQSIAQAAKDFKDGTVNFVSRAAQSVAGAASGAFGTQSMNSMQGAAQVRDYFVKRGWSPQAAAGIAANLLSENDTFDPHRTGDSGKAIGLAQWHADRQAEFRRRYGHPMQQSSRDEQLDFVNYELTQGRYKDVGKRLAGAGSSWQAGAIVSKDYESPRDVDYNIASRGALATRVEAVHVTVELKNAPKGTRATATSDRGATSHAMAH